MRQLLDESPFVVGPEEKPSRPGVSLDEAREIALGLPGVREEERRIAFYVERNGRRRPVTWEWLAATERGGPRLPRPDVLVVRVSSVDERDRMIEGEPEKFSFDLHYSDYPAVLVHLDQVDGAELARLLTSAWRVQALTRGTGPRQTTRRRTSHPELPLSA
jgi:hypothetical protein